MPWNFTHSPYRLYGRYHFRTIHTATHRSKMMISQKKSKKLARNELLDISHKIQKLFFKNFNYPGGPTAILVRPTHFRVCSINQFFGPIFLLKIQKSFCSIQRRSHAKPLSIRWYRTFWRVRWSSTHGKVGESTFVENKKYW